MAPSSAGHLARAVAILAALSPAIGCTTTAVNFVVTDGQAKEIGSDGFDGTAIPPDGADAGDDTMSAVVPDGADATAVPTDGPDAAADDADGAVSPDALAADQAALDADDGGALVIRPADLDAQVADSGVPSFADGTINVPGPSRYVEYKCCTSPTGACFVGYQGDATTCRDQDTWTTYANAACADQGRIMVGLGLYVGC